MHLKEKIEYVIPYVSEEFITFPLNEEGKYIPFVNFWQLLKNKKDLKTLKQKLECALEGTGYAFEFLPLYTITSIQYIQIFPDFIDLDDGGYKFIKEDWSVEEIVDIFAEFIKNNKK